MADVGLTSSKIVLLGFPDVCSEFWILNFGTQFEPTNLSNVGNAVYVSGLLPCLPASELSLSNVGNLIINLL